MKRTMLFSLLALLSISHITNAQVIGGQKNGQSLPSEVKPSEISAGGYSGNVNLFAGTYNASYPLGTVSTPNGLSFSANLSYSSTFTSGDNLPHLTGVPYGEGWSLEIPSISVSTEDYNKYTLWEKYRFTQGHSVPFNDDIYTPLFTLEEAILEENFRRPEGVEFYAEKLFMLPRNLNLICNQVLQKSVSEIIETRKLIEAKNLLTTTDKTIAEIGFDLGYNEKAYFTAVFKKKSGQTPTEFREEMRRLVS